MKRTNLIRMWMLLTVLSAFTSSVVAQTLGGDRNPVRTVPVVSVSVSTILQDWTYADTDVSELSTIISSRIQLRSNLGLAVNVSQATVDHDSLQRITGLTDFQVGLTYLTEFQRSHIIFSMNANLPVGKRNLSKWAYDAAFPMGLSHYNFHTPYFGRGIGFAPGIAWAYSASETMAWGFGATYHFRGDFEPHRSLPEKYNWGNEFSMTGTVQWRIIPTLDFSADVVLTSYSRDKIGDNIVYDAGKRVFGRLDLHAQMGKNDLYTSFRFRSVGTSRIRSLESLQPETINTSTGLIGAGLRYRTRVSSLVLTDFEVEAVKYIDTFEIQDVAPTKLIRYDHLKPIDSLDVFSFGIYPTLYISPALSIPVRFRYSTGDIEGFEAGIGFATII